VDDLALGLADGLDREPHGALDAVEVVLHAAVGPHEQRGRDAMQSQPAG